MLAPSYDQTWKIFAVRLLKKIEKTKKSETLNQKFNIFNRKKGVNFFNLSTMFLKILLETKMLQNCLVFAWRINVKQIIWL